MITPTTISEQLLFSTVRIQANIGSGESVGTGFFFAFPLDEHRTIPAIITNKHVIQGASRGTFQVHEANIANEHSLPSGRFFTVSLDKFETNWIFHPDDQVDLCAMPFQPLYLRAQQVGKSIFYIPLTSAIIPSSDVLNNLSAIEDVVMIGYPTGLWDTANNLPLIRRGITASHPAIDFCGRSEGVVDLACFPGSSGSPVLIVNEGMYTTRQATTVGSRVILLGVLHAGPQWNAQGEIIIREIPTAASVASQTRVMIHLGYIIKARQITALGNMVKDVLHGRGQL